jgi:DNA-binding NarL/FixJ family response regulator
MRTVIIVEDNFIISTFLQEICETNGFAVAGIAADADRAETMLRDSPPDVLLLDYRLNGDRTGLDVAQTAARERPSARRIFVTGNTEPETLAAMRENGPHRILSKPVEPEALLKAMRG